MGYKRPFKLSCSSLIMLRGTSETHRNLYTEVKCVWALWKKKFCLLIPGQRKNATSDKSKWVCMYVWVCVGWGIWLGLSQSYYSRHLLHGASVRTPATQSDPGDEAEEVQLGIVGLASYIQLCSHLSSGAPLFAGGVLRFRKRLASTLVLSGQCYSGSRTEGLSLSVNRAHVMLQQSVWSLSCSDTRVPRTWRFPTVNYHGTWNSPQIHPIWIRHCFHLVPLLKVNSHDSRGYLG